MSYLRHPHTRNELRANENYPALVRAKRRSLPTDWDDKPIHKERSWKSTKRANQWK